MEGSFLFFFFFFKGEPQTLASLPWRVWVCPPLTEVSEGQMSQKLRTFLPLQKAHCSPARAGQSHGGPELSKPVPVWASLDDPLDPLGLS